MISNLEKFLFFNIKFKLGNHDCARVASRVGQKNVDLLNALNLLLGGTPLTYYGEEIGMEDLPYDALTFEESQDEFGKSYGVINKEKFKKELFCKTIYFLFLARRL